METERSSKCFRLLTSDLLWQTFCLTVRDDFSARPNDGNITLINGYDETRIL